MNLATPLVASPDTPPRLASWLLERFSPGVMHEALAGDLQEEFRHGRGRPWYWRQVLSAILIQRSTQLRTNWTALAFAAAWSALSPTLLVCTVGLIENESLMQRLRQLDSPWFTVSKGGLELGIFFLILWLGLTVYVGITARATQSWSPRRFARALLLTVPRFLRMWMLVAVATVLIDMAFPKRIFNLDTSHASGLQMVIAAALSPATLVTFCTMLPSLFSPRPGKRSRLQLG